MSFPNILSSFQMRRCDLIIDGERDIRDRDGDREDMMVGGYCGRVWVWEGMRIEN